MEREEAWAVAPHCAGHQKVAAHEAVATPWAGRSAVPHLKRQKPVEVPPSWAWRRRLVGASRKLQAVPQAAKRELAAGHWRPELVASAAAAVQREEEEVGGEPLVCTHMCRQ